ncbi:pyridine nucleotide-disulfide oxidoreductase [Baekduia soli]|uniref:Pyridine nucleotide-disulfide oxidoreductase n=1 Tax=Baekduia soli TaxID=496014 RepID=A0A5B8U7V8_9ACTN|nr:NAD(P)-binding domain-containing protein [Baekduia soli]QEC48772.1 pyridine nucleotide-disulfide oxidoreductase [Baekduia soli]
MTQHREVVVIGGGQAGLAIGHHLARQDRDFTILDAAAQPAAAWRSRWDSLRLFTPARHDGLPGREFPADPDSHPGRDEVVRYLTDYARDLTLPVELDSTVRAVRRGEHGYVVELDDRTYHADQVVVATGPFQTPRRPLHLAEALDPGVVQLHSSGYRRPEDVPAGCVLVVGGGNSGYQIAEELAADPRRRVHLSVGSRQTPLPTRILGRELFSVLEATGLMHKTVGSRLGRRLKGRDTLVGCSPSRARRQGIRMETRALSASGAAVAFDGGSRLEVDAVIWATGFDADHSWIDVPVFGRDGRIAHQRGVTASPGLYALGLPWLHTRGSALLGWVKDDAEHLAACIAERARALSGDRGAARADLAPRAAARA